MKFIKIFCKINYLGSYFYDSKTTELYNVILSLSFGLVFTLQTLNFKTLSVCFAMLGFEFEHNKNVFYLS